AAGDAGAAADGAAPGDGDGGGDGGGGGQDGAVYPQPGMPLGPGTLPPVVASTAYLGTLKYDNPDIARDLGFSGVVNGQIVWTFGDTLLAPPNGMSIPCSTDSSAPGDLAQPMTVRDTSLP